MEFLFKEVSIFGRRINLVTIVWFVLALIAVTVEASRGDINNFYIFRGVFWHTLEQKHLYPKYPGEYFDSNHYGPAFSLLIAPFALLPAWLGCVLWSMVNAWMLFFAIRRLKIPGRYQVIILAITAIEMMTSTHNVQFNPMLTAWLILAYILVEDEKDFWATLLIAMGFLIKIYGIAGLLFFVFSRHKRTFTLSFLFWLAVGFLLPMLLSSPQYILDTYVEWYEKLVLKNYKNGSAELGDGMQDISVMGMVRRIGGDYSINGLYVMIPAALLIILPLLRTSQYRFAQYRLSYLAIVLISLVIFSSSAESATYVVAVTGVSIWYVLNYRQHKWQTLIMLILLFALTILSATDLYSTTIRTEVFRRYAIKALPPFIVWMMLIKDVLIKDFSKAGELSGQGDLPHDEARSHLLQ